MKTCHCVCLMHRHLSTVECDAARLPSTLQLVRVTVPPRDVLMCQTCADWWRATQLGATPTGGLVATFDATLLHAAVCEAKERRGIASARQVARQIGIPPSLLTRLGQGSAPEATNLAKILLWLGCTDLRKFIRLDGG